MAQYVVKLRNEHRDRLLTKMSLAGGIVYYFIGIPSFL